VSPELNLQVGDQLNALLHFSKNSLKLDDVRQLGVDLSVIQVVLLDMILNHVLVSEYSKLLLKGRLFLLSYVQL